jgi:hypothetical protein
MFAWFFPLGQIKHHIKKTFVKGTRYKDTNARSNALPIHSSQIAMTNGFL